MSILLTVPAHFDGNLIQLDSDIDLKPGTRLLVTILDPAEARETLVWEAMRQSETAFARIWDNDEDAIYDDL